MVIFYIAPFCTVDIYSDTGIFYTGHRPYQILNSPERFLSVGVYIAVKNQDAFCVFFSVYTVLYSIYATYYSMLWKWFLFPAAQLH